MDLESYRFSEAHTWARKEGEEVVIGITEYAANELGDVIFVELPDPGTAISVEQSMGSIESAKAVEDIIAPISGEVVSVNEDVVDAPELLNEDPYEVGWLISVKPRDIKDLDSLLGHDQYMSLVEESGDYGEDEEEEEEDLFTNDE